jgi:hypothetical protein
MEKRWYKKWWGILFIFFVFVSLANITIQLLIKDTQTFKEGAEPDSFRNIKWGSRIESLENMKHIRSEENIGEDTSLYIKTDDELIIGGATLDEIEYSFWNNKFFEVSINANGDRNCTALKESTIERFGKGKYKNKDTIEWIGDKTGANFQVFISNRCGLTIFSYDIYQEMINHSRQKSQNKAKEGAEKGF